MEWGVSQAGVVGRVRCYTQRQSPRLRKDRRRGYSILKATVNEAGHDGSHRSLHWDTPLCIEHYFGKHTIVFLVLATMIILINAYERSFRAVARMEGVTYLILRLNPIVYCKALPVAPAPFNL